MTPSERNTYREQLCAISRQPLEFCPHFPVLAAKWEAWWSGKNAHPMLAASIPDPDAPRVATGKLLELLEDGPIWIQEREKQLAAEIRTKDTLPMVRTDIGPVSVGAFLGAPLHLRPREDTAWQEPIIRDWDELPSLQIDPANHWYRLVMDLAKQTAQSGTGRYLVCTSDLTGPMDILASLRGSEDLCLDLFEEREAVIKVAHRLVDAWETAFDAFHQAVLPSGTGLTQWVGAWSSEPFTTPTCDFNALIGPRDFNEVCLPAYEEQCRRAGRACLHLDGPDAARHHAALASSNLTAIQFTPGAGTPSTLPHVPMFKEFLDAGKPVMVATPFHEVEDLLHQLGSQGVALLVDGCPDADALARLNALAGW